jgi:hypothetical protein
VQEILRMCSGTCTLRRQAIASDFVLRCRLHLGVKRTLIDPDFETWPAGSRAMIFTHLGRIVAFFALLIGVWHVAGGLMIATGGLAPEEFFLKRYFPGNRERVPL